MNYFQYVFIGIGMWATGLLFAFILAGITHPEKPPTPQAKQ